MKKHFLFFFLLMTIQLFSQQTIIKLSEGFESLTFPPAEWKRYNVMGAKIWQRLAAPLPPEIMQPPVQGSCVARINYEETGGEDWLITKKINQISQGDSLSFFIIKQYSEGPFPPDSLLVKVSQTDSLLSSFNFTLININIAAFPTGNQTWHKITLGLSQFAGQNIFIAFEHKNFNGHGIALDSVTVCNKSSIGISGNGKTVPEKSYLYGNFPNPFNPSTIIRFRAAGIKPFVTLKIYDILGKEIFTPVSGFLKPGDYETLFDINDMRGTLMPSGIYFCRMTVSDEKAGSSPESFSGTMILVK